MRYVSLDLPLTYREFMVLADHVLTYVSGSVTPESLQATAAYLLDNHDDARTDRAVMAIANHRYGSALDILNNVR